MNDNARKIFDILGVEPNEIFKINDCDYKYYIDDNLEVWSISYNPYRIENCSKIFIELINNPERIIKLPKELKKKKLRDLTPEEWDKWRSKNCKLCYKCIFHYVYCDKSRYKSSWMNNKKLYSDEFLNQEIEVEE